MIVPLVTTDSCGRFMLESTTSVRRPITSIGLRMTISSVMSTSVNINRHSLFLQSTQHLPSKDMCTAELIGDYYRGCQHFVGLYYTGERTDCNSPKCGVSAAHRHTAPNCPCPKQDQDERKVRNMFQVSCDACRAAAFERLSSGRG